IEAGMAADRSVCLLGRAMQRMMRAATETGVAEDFPPLVGVEQAVEIPRRHLMLIVSGSQGERRAVSAQLSRGRYLGLAMQEGDLFLFSSKTIPGNEIGVTRIVNAFSEMGVNVIDGSSDLYHVSGHANRPDLARIHALMRPQMLIPMHGEHRHLRAHVKLGSERGIPGRVVSNGMMVSLSGPEPEVIGHVDTGRVYLDGIHMVGALDGVIRGRIGLAINGLVTVGVALDENNGIAGGVRVATRGLAATGRSATPLADEIENAVNSALARLKPSRLAEDAGIEEIVRRTVRSVCTAEIGKKPEVAIPIVSIPSRPRTGNSPDDHRQGGTDRSGSKLKRPARSDREIG
ncbi:MAG: ribonuclease J, partial [Pseudomonadota bacterium]